jgi:hypothetical protein
MADDGSILVTRAAADATATWGAFCAALSVSLSQKTAAELDEMLAR